MDPWVIELGFLCATGHTVSLVRRDQIFLEFMKLSVIDTKLSSDSKSTVLFCTNDWSPSPLQESSAVLPVCICLVHASSPAVPIVFSPWKYADAVNKSPLNHLFFGRLTRINLSSFSKVSLSTPVFILRLFSYSFWFRMWLQNWILYASVLVTNTIYGNKDTSTSLHLSQTS